DPHRQGDQRPGGGVPPPYGGRDSGIPLQPVQTEPGQAKETVQDAPDDGALSVKEGEGIQDGEIGDGQKEREHHFPFPHHLTDEESGRRPQEEEKGGGAGGRSGEVGPEGLFLRVSRNRLAQKDGPPFSGPGRGAEIKPGQEDEYGRQFDGDADLPGNPERVQG